MQYIPEPVDFLRSVHAATKRTGSPTRLFLESRCIEHSLRRGAVEDFCYETCSYFDSGSLTFAMQRAGFAVRGVARLFDDQYLIAEADAVYDESTRAEPPGDVAEMLALARRYAANARTLRTALHTRFRTAGRRGKVAIWGAATKGVTLANLVDPDGTLLDCLIDINPDKQDRFLPQSCHAVVGPRAAADRGVRTAFVANAAYELEIAASVAKMNLPIRIETLPAAESIETSAH